jgi:hypothetical protein
MRKCVFASFAVLVAISFCVAETYNNCKVLEIKDGKITVEQKGKKKGAEAKKLTFPIAATVVVKTGKGSFDKAAKKFSIEEGDAIEGGLKAATVFGEDKLKDGVNVQLTTEGTGDSEKVTKVIVIAGKKKKAAN